MGPMHKKNHAGSVLMLTAGLSMVVLITGCSGNKDRKRNTPPIARQDLLPRPAFYPALNGTVESVAAVASANPVLVRGYGIVAGLPNTGSGEMPTEIRRMMMNRLLKNNIGFLSHGTAQYDPSKILRSRQIAAVFVEGVIPPLATRGSTFDLKVVALPNTQTTSVANGLLWTTPLRVHIGFNNRSHALAQGRGPIFCNPLSGPGGTLMKPDAIIRDGRVMSGGIVTAKMPVILELYTPSYRISLLVERIINQRYGSYPPVASAQNDSIIQLRIPHRYQNNARHFVNLAMHLYLEQNVPGFTQMQAKRLLKALSDPLAPPEQISLALAQLGRTILPEIEPYYHSQVAQVSFYSARAGALIGDQDAITVLKAIAEDPLNHYRFLAVKALEQSHNPVRASLAFAHLLKSKSDRLRIAGYKALLKINSPLIYSQAVGDKFILDIVRGRGPTLVYVTRTGYPRVAIIGKVPSLIPGSLYVSAHNAITVNYPISPAGKKSPAKAAVNGPVAQKLPIELYYRDRMTHKHMQMKCTALLPDVITAMATAPNPFAANYNPRAVYIAASYQRIVAMLYTMCANGNIPAKFIMQKKAPPSMRLYASLNEPRASGHRLGVKDGTRIFPPASSQPASGRSPYSSKLPGEQP